MMAKFVKKNPTLTDAIQFHGGINNARSVIQWIRDHADLKSEWKATLGETSGYHEGIWIDGKNEILQLDDWAVSHGFNSILILTNEQFKETYMELSEVTRGE